MRNLMLGFIVVGSLGTAAALSNFGRNSPRTEFPREDRNPASHFRWNEADGDFQFAFVSDRTGGHRANVFAQAIHKLNLLQPAFVVSVGDLIEGGKKADDVYRKEWKTFDDMVSQLNMPFFYVAGNHDVGAKESAKYWEDKLGRKHYHFVYRNVLFLLLNSDDPPGQGNGNLGAEQIAWAKKTLADNAKVRWSVVVVHRPLWTIGNGVKNGWKEIEDALAGRRYTAFAGHVHRFQKWVRNGQNYYQLATTGGVSQLRGVEQGEFDHITWVTMKNNGPVLAHLTLDAIHSENLQPPVTDEAGVARTQVPLYPVRGQAYYQGTPMPGAVVTLTPDPKAKKGVAARGIVQGDGSFALTTYRGDDGAAVGDYVVTVTWRDGKAGTSLLPAKYAKAEQSGLKASVQSGTNQLVLELTQ